MKKKSNTLLIKPNSKGRQYGSTISLSAIEPPLWLAILANCYENPKIWDMEACPSHSASEMRRFCYQLKGDKVVILATGSHPSAHIQQKDSMEYVKTMFENIGKKVEAYNYLPSNPIKCGQPRWDLLDMKKYRAHNWHCWGFGDRNNYGSIYTSISCPYKCEFCTVKSFYKSNYQKRPTVEALADIHEQYSLGVRNFKMMDEIFTGSHAMEFCEDLRYSIGRDINIWAYARIDTVTPKSLRKMRQAGVRWLAYGIETGNDDIRKQIMKGKFDKQKIRDVVKMTKDEDINVLGNFMFGFWEDTMDTMKETLDFAKELNCEYANFYCTVAYPGSKLYDDMKSAGVKLPEKSIEYAQLSPEFKPLSTKYLSAKEVLKFRDEAFTDYFTRPEYMSLFEQRFGAKDWKEVVDMVSVKLERNLLNE